MFVTNFSMRNSRQQQIALIATVAAFIGFFDASYLTAKSLGSGPVVCNLLDGCNVVLNSPWSQIWGLPTALYGVGYYGMLLFLLVAFWYWQDETVLRTLFIVSSVGLLASFWFVYLQLFVIGAVCEYCLLSAITTAIVWVGAVGLLYKRE